MNGDNFDDTLDEDMILALTQATDAAAAAATSSALTRSVSTAGFARAPARPQNFRQTTLWGSTLREDQRPTPSQGFNSRPFRADLPPEPPTHHELNRDELATWVYPLNLGPIRDYQFSIVKNGLFNNTLVALPTGLGKTFIAATIMLNYFRWTRRAKIVFVAPTKPLASQQVQACLNVAGIPRSQATLLTGETAPVLREAEWESKRLFFMTPQTLMNDLSKGYADPKSIVLLVIDEAHRSTGDYAYVKVVEFIRRFSKSFRVLALTATPGSTVEGVQDIIDNLGISHVEIRTEESIDIRQYVHARSIDTVTFDPSDEMLLVRDLFSKALKPLVDKMSAQNIYYGRDPMNLTTYGLLKSRNEWMSGPGRHVNQGTKFMMMAVFGILQSLAHAIKLLNFHGIKPFYNNLAEFRSTEESKPGQGSKLRRQLLDDENFQKMMSTIEGWLKLKEFNGHPKLTYLCETLVNHFIDAGENSNTRAIVFSEYRDSAEEIVRLLNSQPLVSATVFVGQADSKRSEGMKQKQQIETIEKFKSGSFNVLVATSIGEEGLDIGQVDLIVCYDASSSPIRMLQRMGRTGRKRAGNIVLLLMKGKEEDKFAEAKDNYQRMQQLICNGESFAFRHDLSTRIVPRDIRPEVDKRHVDIPIENSQDPSLPEPKKTAAGLRKKPAKKKFNMPDGVETGFIKASFFGRPAARTATAPRKPAETDFLADVPELEKVLLSKSQTDILERVYKSLPSRPSHKVEHIEDVQLGAYPVAQRALRPTVQLKHGEYTRRCVRLFRTLGKSQDPSRRYTYPYGEADTTSWQTLPVKSFAEDSDGETITQQKRQHSDDCAGGNQDVRESKRRPVAGKTNKGNKKSRKDKTEPVFLSDCEEANDSEDEDKDDITVGEATPQHRRSRGRGRGGRTAFKRSHDYLEDIGDDCTRTSDMEQPEDSDSGADLADFIVGDDEDVFMSSIPQESTRPMTPQSSGLSVRHKPGRRARDDGQITPKEKPFFEPMQFGPTQDTDDEMPDVDELVARSVSAKKAKQRADSRAMLFDGDGSGDTQPRPSPRRPAAKRRRQVMADSDDE
ncbi:ATP-dependent DNA helicase MPH1 [Madurella mycetomatis]|uniref:ATP-dependent DNA helicase n=1 Tax=Madurella mycetomatis TaxID=100816 RepID=A0A175W8A3_9PEZI|nr:ATP-dependent DNA helicase MPH1 [Madurella mycetomatis]